MASEDSEKSPFTRPGFIAAAIVVALIVVCAIILVIVNLSRGNPEPAPSTSEPSSTTAPSTPAASGDESVCGLGGVELSGTVTAAPETTWKYQDVLAYPSSATAGPGATDPSGYRYCFARTPEGALFAAGNMAMMSFDNSIRSTWLPYVLSKGQYHDTLLSAALGASESNLRTNIAGFRVLSYDGERALVDIAFQTTGSGQIVTGSFAVHLVWSEGDWKIDASMSNPTNIAQLPNLAGYTSWTAS